MIKSKEDLYMYLDADAKALGKTHPYGFKDWLMDEIWTYERLLRKVEYYHNCKKTLWGGVRRRLLYWRLQKRAIRLGFSIPINTCGPGLSIAHYGPIVVSTLTKIGKNCRIHVGVNIGEKNKKAPQIGDNVYIGPGAKLFGDIVIGDNTQIGANAVVNKSFPEGNCTLVGVPARAVVSC